MYKFRTPAFPPTPHSHLHPIPSHPHAFAIPLYTHQSKPHPHRTTFLRTASLVEDRKTAILPHVPIQTTPSQNNVPQNSLPQLRSQNKLQSPTRVTPKSHTPSQHQIAQKVSHVHVRVSVGIKSMSGFLSISSHYCPFYCPFYCFHVRVYVGTKSTPFHAKLNMLTRTSHHTYIHGFSIRQRSYAQTDTNAQRGTHAQKAHKHIAVNTHARTQTHTHKLTHSRHEVQRTCLCQGGFSGCQLVFQLQQLL